MYFIDDILQNIDLNNDIETSMKPYSDSHCLTHWGRPTHIRISRIITIASDNGLSSGLRQAIFVSTSISYLYYDATTMIIKCWGNCRSYQLHSSISWVTYENKCTVLQNFHSFPSCAACIRHWIGSALVKIMTCRGIGAKPLSKSMLGYCQLDSKKQTSVKF